MQAKRLRSSDLSLVLGLYICAERHVLCHPERVSQSDRVEPEGRGAQSAQRDLETVYST